MSGSYTQLAVHTTISWRTSPSYQSELTQHARIPAYCTPRDCTTQARGARNPSPYRPPAVQPRAACTRHGASWSPCPAKRVSRKNVQAPCATRRRCHASCTRNKHSFAEDTPEWRATRDTAKSMWFGQLLFCFCFQCVINQKMKKKNQRKKKRGRPPRKHSRDGSKFWFVKRNVTRNRAAIEVQKWKKKREKKLQHIVLQCKIKESTSWMSLDCSEVQEFIGRIRIQAILKSFISSSSSSFCQETYPSFNWPVRSARKPWLKHFCQVVKFYSSIIFSINWIIMSQ